MDTTNTSTQKNKNATQMSDSDSVQNPQKDILQFMERTTLESFRFHPLGSSTDQTTSGVPGFLSSFPVLSKHLSVHGWGSTIYALKNITKSKNCPDWAIFIKMALNQIAPLKLEYIAHQLYVRLQQCVSPKTPELRIWLNTIPHDTPRCGTIGYSFPQQPTLWASPSLYYKYHFTSTVGSLLPIHHDKKPVLFSDEFFLFGRTWGDSFLQVQFPETVTSGICSKDGRFLYFSTVSGNILKYDTEVCPGPVNENIKSPLTTSTSTSASTPSSLFLTPKISKNPVSTHALIDINCVNNPNSESSTLIVIVDPNQIVVSASSFDPSSDLYSDVVDIVPSPSGNSLYLLRDTKHDIVVHFLDLNTLEPLSHPSTKGISITTNLPSYSGVLLSENSSFIFSSGTKINHFQIVNSQNSQNPEISVKRTELSLHVPFFSKLFKRMARKHNHRTSCIAPCSDSPLGFRCGFLSKDTFSLVEPDSSGVLHVVARSKLPTVKPTFLRDTGFSQETVAIEITMTQDILFVSHSSGSIFLFSLKSDSMFQLLYCLISPTDILDLQICNNCLVVDSMGDIWFTPISWIKNWMKSYPQTDPNDYLNKSVGLSYPNLLKISETAGSLWAGNSLLMRLDPVIKSAQYRFGKSLMSVSEDGRHEAGKRSGELCYWPNSLEPKVFKLPNSGNNKNRHQSKLTPRFLGILKDRIVWLTESSNLVSLSIPSIESGTGIPQNFNAQDDMMDELGQIPASNLVIDAENLSENVSGLKIINLLQIIGDVTLGIIYLHDHSGILLLNRESLAFMSNIFEGPDWVVGHSKFPINPTYPPRVSPNSKVFYCLSSGVSDTIGLLPYSFKIGISEITVNGSIIEICCDMTRPDRVYAIVVDFDLDSSGGKMHFVAWDISLYNQYVQTVVDSVEQDNQPEIPYRQNPHFPMFSVEIEKLGIHSEIVNIAVYSDRVFFVSNEPDTTIFTWKIPQDVTPMMTGLLTHSSSSDDDSDQDQQPSQNFVSVDPSDPSHSGDSTEGDYVDPGATIDILASSSDEDEPVIVPSTSTHDPAESIERIPKSQAPVPKIGKASILSPLLTNVQIVPIFYDNYMAIVSSKYLYIYTIDTCKLIHTIIADRTIVKLVSFSFGKGWLPNCSEKYQWWNIYISGLQAHSSAMVSVPVTTSDSTGSEITMF